MRFTFGARGAFHLCCQFGLTSNAFFLLFARVFRYCYWLVLVPWCTTFGSKALPQTAGWAGVVGDGVKCDLFFFSCVSLPRLEHIYSKDCGISRCWPWTSFFDWLLVAPWHSAEGAASNFKTSFFPVPFVWRLYQVERSPWSGQERVTWCWVRIQQTTNTVYWTK